MMTPAELAKSGSEHGEQRALFAWVLVAEQYGFNVAWDWAAGMGLEAAKSSRTNEQPVHELKWFHAIPNGGLRDKRTAAMLKAEGVKRGIPDTFLPVPLWGAVTPAHTHLRCMLYAGLYIEMKRSKSEGRAKGRTSSEQEDAVAWLRHSGYAVAVCFTWDQAARELQSYIEAMRKGASKQE
jgi:hypothetical protein